MDAYWQLNHIDEWLSKRILTTQDLGKVKSEFKRDIVGYFSLKRFQRPIHPDITLRFTYLQQLGELLFHIGHAGRQKITSIEFEWDLRSPSLQSYQGSEAWEVFDFWYRKDTPAKIFTLLADCSNLRSLKIRIDLYILLQGTDGPGDGSESSNSCAK